jgi:hypothetical protein
MHIIWLTAAYALPTPRARNCYLPVASSTIAIKARCRKCPKNLQTDYSSDITIYANDGFLHFKSEDYNKVCGSENFCCSTKMSRNSKIVLNYSDKMITYSRGKNDKIAPEKEKVNCNSGSLVDQDDQHAKGVIGHCYDNNRNEKKNAQSVNTYYYHKAWLGWGDDNCCLIELGHKVKLLKNARDGKVVAKYDPMQENEDLVGEEVTDAVAYFQERFGAMWHHFTIDKKELHGRCQVCNLENSKLKDEQKLELEGLTKMTPTQHGGRCDTKSKEFYDKWKKEKKFSTELTSKHYLSCFYAEAPKIEFGKPGLSLFGATS